MVCLKQYKNKKIKDLYYLVFLIIVSVINNCYICLNNKERLLQDVNTKIQPTDEPSEVCSEGIEAAHSPFGAETDKMRYETIIIFGCLSISIMLFRALSKTLALILTKFNVQTLKLIFRYSFMYLILIGIVSMIYSLSGFDSYKFNIEGLLLGFYVFFFFYFVMAVILSLSYSKYIEFLNNLDNNPNFNSFKSIKDQFEKIRNSKLSFVDMEKALNPIFEAYEFLIMKKYFIVPFYPVFKPSTLRHDFKFGYYLQKCLTSQIKNFYSLSWTTLIITSLFVFFWSVVIDPTIIDNEFMLLFPCFTITMLYLISYYLNVVYRRIVPKVDHINYIDLNHILDFDNPNQNTNFNNYSKCPIYIEKLLDGNGNFNQTLINPVNNLSINAKDLNTSNNNSFTKHFNGRSESLYEENIIFGKSGFAFFSNLIQFLNVITILWLSVMVTKYLPEFLLNKEFAFFVTFILLFIIYIIVVTINTKRSIKTISILNSTEMNRNDSIIKKAIQKQIHYSAKLSNSIINNFRKIYFDLKSESDKNFNSIHKKALIPLVDINLQRFKKGSCINNQSQNYTKYNTISNNYEKNVEIKLNSELSKFTQACGNNMNNKEIENMLYYIDDIIKVEERGSLNNRNFYDIWGANMFFAKEGNFNIMLYVLNRFDEINSHTKENNEIFGKESLQMFFDYYGDYFTKEEIDFANKEAKLLKLGFTKNVFIQTICTMAKYYPY